MRINIVHSGNRFNFPDKCYKFHIYIICGFGLISVETLMFCFRIKVSTKIWIYSDFGSNIGFYWIAIFKKNYQNCKFS